MTKLDMSYHARMEELTAKRAELQNEMLNTPEPKPSALWIANPLDLLDESQVEAVADYVMFELGPIIKSTPLGEPFVIGEWFWSLSALQQQQVFDFFDKELLSKNGLILTWYANFGQNGFRFEIDNRIPAVAS